MLGMAVGCYLAAFKKADRGPLLLGFGHEDEVKAKAAEVLGVAPASVKQWYQEFLPYWKTSRRRQVFPGWIPSGLRGRLRKPKEMREKCSRMFADFEMKPEQELVEMCKAILDMSSGDNPPHSKVSKIKPLKDLPLEIGVIIKSFSTLFPIFESVSDDSFDSAGNNAKSEANP